MQDASAFRPVNGDQLFKIKTSEGTSLFPTEIDTDTSIHNNPFVRNPLAPAHPTMLSLETQATIVGTVAHELLHAQDGFWRTISGQGRGHEEIKRIENLIQDKYLEGLPPRGGKHPWQ